jgi:hypothetical protein
MMADIVGLFVTLISEYRKNLTLDRKNIVGFGTLGDIGVS